ncbi:TadE/TadG family type IV pilus assembly protein [Algicella marina]|uniref:Putative Flp pilus-assembly TadG-like N-terminal domain-containing protein n=1 Tax=Algicella marina TaxID=2683284 RepID=A0A6P1T2G0_9RHOB|nr:TadE/TadG family type IV pilus assembly protein [Algicella marina]QHQ35980.1 hypothetical protein GO499_12765 [Algicella marina]
MDKLKQTLRDEDGAIMPMIVLLFLTMVVMTGMGVDFMRHEAARADLQNALDRGVLAATSLSQTLAQREEGKSQEQLEQEKKELILSYMKARTFDRAVPAVNVRIPDGLADYESAVEASASYDLDTFFLKIAGFGEMKIPAASYAEQRRLDIEIALVLDVSGSMLSSSNVPVDPNNPRGAKKIRMQAMQDAVTGFTTDLFEDQELGQTLVSVVPYTSNSSANAFMAEHFNLQPVKDFLFVHDYSYCFQFNTEGTGGNSTVRNNPDFSRVEIRGSLGDVSHRQQQHFPEVTRGQGQYYFNNEHRYGCPVAENRIMPYATNASDVVSMVNGMKAENYTATYSGVKWAAALLDTSSRGLVTDMIDHSHGPTDPRASVALPSEYDGWPHDYTDNTAHKYLIIMTDGRNTQQRRIINDSDYYSPTPGYSDWRLRREQRERLERWNNAWFGDNNDGLKDSEAVVNNVEGDNLTEMICDAAKESAGGGNLTIFTITYALSNDTAGNAARDVMRHCATDASTDFFDIGAGDDPKDAFDAIQTRLTLLKLSLNDDDR